MHKPLFILGITAFSAVVAEENPSSTPSHSQVQNQTMNPATPFAVKNGVNLWVDGEVLWMKATEDGLQYAFEDTEHVPDTPRGSYKNVNYDWSWGARVGAGYYPKHDGWDIYARWTWFHAHGHAHTSNTILFPSTIYPSLVVHSSSDIDSHLRLQINLGDLELGREFFVSKWLALHPHFGITGGWFYRRLDNSLSSLIGPTPVPLPDAVLDVLTKCRFAGAGLRAGLDTTAGLGCGWSIFNELSFSLLYGRQKLFHEDTVFINGNKRLGGLGTFNWRTVRAIADLALGLGWEGRFSQDRFRLRFELAWETLLLFDFNQNITNSSFADPGIASPRSGDLAITGLAGQVRFDF